MAKAKKKPDPGPITLTDEQVGKLADKLIYSRQNVYQLAERMFGVQVGDEVFEQLGAGSGGIFRCEECNEWLPNDMKDQIGDCCRDCVDEIDADDDDCD